MSKYLLSNTNVTLKLYRSKPEFCLIGDEAVEASVIFEECFLRVRRVKVAPYIMVSHAKELEKTTAKYPIKRVMVKTYTVPYASSKCSIVGIQSGIMPSRVVCGF